MRWKLLLIASLLAAALSAGVLLAFGLPYSTERTAMPRAVLFVTLFVPVLSVAGASIFVYRHTARRRKLQAAATALLASLLTLTALAAGTIFLARRRAPPREPMPTPARDLSEKTSRLMRDAPRPDTPC